MSNLEGSEPLRITDMLEDGVDVSRVQMLEIVDNGGEIYNKLHLVNTPGVKVLFSILSYFDTKKEGK